MLNRSSGRGFWMLVVAAAGVSSAALAAPTDNTLIVTASNTAVNQLLIYGVNGALVKSISTQGQGGVGGNAGGIAQSRDRLAVVNFGSGSVSVFTKDFERATVHLESVISTNGNPVSVAFGHDHLYILTTTHVESHRIGWGGVNAATDGVVRLALGDGSAAQVGVLPASLLITEKAGVIETIPLDARRAVGGAAATVAGGLAAPFGFATRGDNAYVTIAHSNSVSLVRNGKVLTSGSTGAQNAPCWAALDGPFLFSTNSPSHSLSRFAVYGKVITLDAEVAATFNGAPTDIDYRAGLAAVVDATPTASHVSIFSVDEDGQFKLKNVATIATTTTNGVAIVNLGRGNDERGSDE